MISIEQTATNRPVDQNMIFDIGVNKGEDTRFYLDKGFKVVGVEANPVIVEQLKIDFASDISNGNFILKECGVWNERSELTFYRNLDNDHWSSFDQAYGCRNGTKFNELKIECITVSDLFDGYGVPRYLKIDVEGADKFIVADLKELDVLPVFVSVEEYGLDALVALKQAGYTKFKFSPQRDKTLAIPPNPAKEGVFIDKKFDGYDSGLFGLDLPGEWLGYNDAFDAFSKNIRSSSYEYVGPEHEWYDVHAML